MPSLIQDNITRAIGTHGHSVVGVPGFAYTIGLQKDKLPELLIVGNFDNHLLGMALNDLAKIMRERGSPLPEGEFDMDWSVLVKIRKAGPKAKTDFTIQAGQYFDTEDYDVLQVMLPDKAGKFPGDEGCHPHFDVEQV
jgi:hypothetical protein